jgi:hypothetical protein
MILIGSVRCFTCWLVFVFVFCSGLATGNSITTLDIVGDVGRFSSLVLSANGNPVISYYDMSNRSLKLLRCNNFNCVGKKSYNIITPDAAGMVGSYTSLVLDNTGKPVVSYYDSSKGRLKLLHCKSDNCKRAELSSQIPSLPTENIVGKYTSLVLDVKGNPVVSYYDFSSGNLKLLHCNSPSCIGNDFGTITTPDILGDVGLHTSLVLDAIGNPVISYYNSSSRELRLLHCDDLYCMGDESKNIVVLDVGAGWYTSLVLDSAGNPVVSYFDFSNSDLKLVHCDDPHCLGDESSHIATLDTAGIVGSYTSLALDNKGNPVVSYYDSSNGNLKLLYCDDPNCKGDESGNITVLDSSNDVGLHTSLVLDSTGNPVVSYYDFTNGNLKLLYCTSPTSPTCSLNKE